MKGKTISTFASADEIRKGIKDEHRVLYSPDGKRTYGTVHRGIKSYHIRPGTEVVCDRAFWFQGDLESIYIPAWKKLYGDSKQYSYMNSHNKRLSHANTAYSLV